MIKNYNIFRLNEGITLSSKEIVDILRNLEASNNKNEELINRLISYTDNKGVNMLMHITMTKDQDLIDYILKFNIDKSHINKNGENILFYCRDIKTFNKFYELGADVKVVNKGDKNILNYLGGRKIFDVDLYQKLIDDGVSINDMDHNGNNVLTYSIFNQKTLNLLIKNKVDLNNLTTQHTNLFLLLNKMAWYKKEPVIKIMKILFENGMKILKQNINFFCDKMVDCERYSKNIPDTFILDFIKQFHNYIPEEVVLKLAKEKLMNVSHDMEKEFNFLKELISIKIYPDVVKYFIMYYKGSPSREKLNKLLRDYMEEHPYINDSEKFNI